MHSPSVPGAARPPAPPAGRLPAGLGAPTARITVNSKIGNINTELASERESETGDRGGEKMCGL